MDIGEHKIGMIARDADDHYLFVENAAERKKTTTVMHNPRMFKGECINVRLKADGTPYVTLRRPTYEGTEGFTWFCRKAAQELLTMQMPLRDKTGVKTIAKSQYLSISVKKKEGLYD